MGKTPNVYAIETMKPKLSPLGLFCHGHRMFPMNA